MVSDFFSVSCQFDRGASRKSCKSRVPPRLSRSHLAASWAQRNAANVLSDVDRLAAEHRTWLLGRCHFPNGRKRVGRGQFRRHKGRNPQPSSVPGDLLGARWTGEGVAVTAAAVARLDVTSGALERNVRDALYKLEMLKRTPRAASTRELWSNAGELYVRCAPASTAAASSADGNDDALPRSCLVCSCRIL